MVILFLSPISSTLSQFSVKIFPNLHALIKAHTANNNNNNKKMIRIPNSATHSHSSTHTHKTNYWEIKWKIKQNPPKEIKKRRRASDPTSTLHLMIKCQLLKPSNWNLRRSMGEWGLDPAKRFLFSTIGIETMSRRERDRESENFQMCTHTHTENKY